FLCVLVISFSQFLITSFRRTPIVRAPIGPIRGTVLHTVWNAIEYSSFKGIPYAKPPLGDLRFKPPVPTDRWKKVLNAFKEGSVCPQSDFATSELTGCEDCLYLNVYTRELKFKSRLQLKPVMVWIHGGGYFSGYSNSSLYGPDFFLEADVVFVSFNYRLGVLGFLALDHPNATGNAGLKDQQLALQWVQNNIAAFGGNPKQVTIFGESAGSTSIGFHMLSERSRGLFLRSISMSGTPLCPWAFHTPEEMIRNAHKLAHVLGFIPKDKDDLLNYLRQTPALHLANAAKDVDLNFLPFRPTIENPHTDLSNSTFLTECPITKYHNGDFYHHDTMLGYTRDELVMFLGPSIRVANMIDWAKRYLQNIDKHNLGIISKPTNLMAEFVTNLVKSSLKSLMKVGMDIFFSSPIDLTQRLLAKHNTGHPNYYYRLSYETKYAMHRLQNNPLNGTAHFDDVGYIFNAKSLHAPIDPKDKFNLFRKKMVTLWTNFAKYGDPTPKNFNQSTFDVTWIDSGNEGFQLDINTMSTMKKRLVDQKTADYEKLLYRILPMTTSCVKKPMNFLDIF
ncbi:Esterase B1, partial [Eufriesea mexicana]